MTRSAVISLLVGLVVAALLVADNDPAAILRILLQAGWGLAAVVALHLPQILLSALGWAPLIDDPRRPGWAGLARLRWIREAVNNLLPVAQIGGEVVRAQLLTLCGVRGVTATASLVVDLAIEMAALIVFAAAGLLMLALLPHQGGMGRWTAVIATTIGGTMAAAFMMAQLLGLFRLTDRLLPWLARRTGWQAPDGISGLHDAVVRLYHAPRRLWLGGAAHLAAWLLGTLEIWAALRFLGIEIGLAEALVVESLGQVLRSMGFLVPGALGVQEGGFVLTCALFGIPAEQAIALSLLRRLRDIVLGLPGLVAWRREIAAGARPPATTGGLP